MADEMTTTRLVQRLFRTGGALFPGAAAQAAERLFFTPRRFPAPARERAWLQGSEPFVVETRAGALTGRVWGDALDPFPWGGAAQETVLLVHGWEGRGTQLGAFAAPLARAGLRVVTYDGPAHGRSPGGRTDLPTFAACVADAARQLGPVRAIVGHSMGAAATALALADAGGALDVGRAVLIAPPASVRAVTAKFAALVGLPPPALAAFRRRFEARYGADAFERLAADGAAARVLRPALIVHDEDDREVDVAEGARVAAAWRGARFLRTRGLGHRRVLRDPAVIDEVVRFVVGARHAALRAA